MRAPVFTCALSITGQSGCATCHAWNRLDAIIDVARNAGPPPSCAIAAGVSNVSAPVSRRTEVSSPAIETSIRGNDGAGLPGSERRNVTGTIDVVGAGFQSWSSSVSVLAG